jgi:hypothetical protein
MFLSVRCNTTINSVVIYSNIVLIAASCSVVLRRPVVIVLSRLIEPMYFSLVQNIKCMNENDTVYSITECDLFFDLIKYVFTYNWIGNICNQIFLLTRLFSQITSIYFNILLCLSTQDNKRLIKIIVRDNVFNPLIFCIYLLKMINVTTHIEGCPQEKIELLNDIPMNLIYFVVSPNMVVNCNWNIIIYSHCLASLKKISGGVIYKVNYFNIIYTHTKSKYDYQIIIIYSKYHNIEHNCYYYCILSSYYTIVRALIITLLITLSRLRSHSSIKQIQMEIVYKWLKQKHMI